MEALSVDPPRDLREQRRWPPVPMIRTVFASIAISVIWLAVLFDALFGPDFVTSNSNGTTTIPSAVFVAVFAYLATRVVARYGLAERPSD